MRTDDLRTLIDTLIPPLLEEAFVASSAIDPAAIDLGEEDRFAACELDRKLALAPVDAREAAVAEAQASDPDRFRRLLKAVYVAVYSSPEMAARVARLAEDSPRDRSAHFDSSLLAGVIEGRRGERRL